MPDGSSCSFPGEIYGRTMQTAPYDSYQVGRYTLTYWVLKYQNIADSCENLINPSAKM